MIENSKGLWLLYSSGRMQSVDEAVLGNVLFMFKKINYFDKDLGDDSTKWNDLYPDIGDVPGETKVYITDNYDLVIRDVGVFSSLFNAGEYSLSNYLTVPEYAKQFNKSIEQVKVFCRTGRIPGAQKVGRDWLIPKSCLYPNDRRYSKKTYTCIDLKPKDVY